jgi:hypothetical protein
VDFYGFAYEIYQPTTASLVRGKANFRMPWIIGKKPQDTSPGGVF